MIRSILAAVVVTLCFSANADVFKCRVDGKLVYQEAPCGDAEIKSDAPWERERKAAAQEKLYRDKLKEVEALQKKQQQIVLAQCKSADTPCTAGALRWMMKGLTQFELTDLLGRPSNVQEIGRKELWYFNLPIESEAGVSVRRVQVLFESGTHTSNGRSSLEPMVSDVNVY